MVIEVELCNQFFLGFLKGEKKKEKKNHFSFLDPKETHYPGIVSLQ